MKQIVNFLRKAKGAILIENNQHLITYYFIYAIKMRISNVITTLSFLILLTPGISAQKLKILPLGNSLTFGQDTRGIPVEQCVGYRYALYQSLIAGGYTFDFVGNVQAGSNYLPYNVIDSLNYTQCAGFPGAQTEHISRILRTGKGDPTPGMENVCLIWDCPQRYLNVFNPDAILLHIGTNNISTGVHTAQQIRDTVNTILNVIDEYEQYSGKTVPVFLARIILRENLPVNASANLLTQQYNNLLSELAATRSSDEIMIVDMESGAGINYDNITIGGDMYDTWHPGTTGYAKMAAKWYQALENYNFRAPVVGNIPNQTINEGQTYITLDLKPYVFDPQEKDEDIVWSYTPYPSAHYNISFSNGVATISRKNAGWSGDETLTFKAEDSGNGGTPLYDTDIVTITSIAPNEPPVINDRGPFYVDEDSQIRITLDSLSVTDPNNIYPDDFTLHILSGANYTVVSGNIISPDANYHGTLTVPLYVNDGMENSPTKNMSVIVKSINDSPWMTLPNPRTVPEDSYYDKTVTAGDNDTENTLTLAAVGTLPDWLTFVPATGRLYGTPRNEHVGNNYATIRVNDGTVSVDSIFKIVVNNTNDLPSIVSFPADTLINIIQLFDYTVIATDIDPTSDPLTYDVPVKPDWITYDDLTHRLYGTPGIENMGNHPVSISVSDGNGYTYQHFTLVVENINYPPVITSEPLLMTDEDLSYIYAIKATDTENDTLNFSFVKKPEWLDFFASGVFMGTPGDEDVGIHEIIYAVADAKNMVYDTFNLTVNNVNDIPVITGTSQELYTKIDTPLLISLNDLSVDDPDNIYPDEFSLKLLDGNNYTVSDNVIIPDNGFMGKLNIGVQVNDGTADSEPATIEVSVVLTGLYDPAISHSLIEMIYPNPAAENITFMLKDPIQKGTIELFDSSLKKTGHYVITETADAISIDISYLSNGLYFFRINNENGYSSGKFLKAVNR